MGEPATDKHSMNSLEYWPYGVSSYGGASFHGLRHLEQQDSQEVIRFACQEPKCAFDQQMPDHPRRLHQLSAAGWLGSHLPYMLYLTCFMKQSAQSLHQT